MQRTSAEYEYSFCRDITLPDKNTVGGLLSKTKYYFKRIEIASFPPGPERKYQKPLESSEATQEIAVTETPVIGGVTHSLAPLHLNYETFDAYRKKVLKHSLNQNNTGVF